MIFFIKEHFSKFCFIILLAFVCLTSCTSSQTKKVTLTAQVQKKRTISLNYSGNPLNTNFQYSPKANELIVFNTKTNTVFRFNYPTFAFLDSFKLPIHTKGYGFFIHYENHDSIFVLDFVSPSRSYDSVLLRFNAQGKLLESYSLDNMPVKTKNKNPNPSRDSACTIREITGLCYHNQKFFFRIRKSYYRLSDTNFNAVKIPLFGHLSISKEDREMWYPHPLKFPEQAIGKEWISSFGLPERALNHKGNPVYSFGMTQLYHEYDLKTKKMISKHVKSALLDTVTPIPLDSLKKPLFDFDDPTNGEFFYLYFDPYRKWYIRLIELRADLSTIGSSMKRTYGFAVIDTNFNLLGEGILPEKIQPNKIIPRWIKGFITPEGIYWMNNISTEKDLGQKLHFELYNIELKTSGIRANIPYYPKPVLPKEDWPKYLKEIQKIKQKDEPLILFVPLDQSCTACMKQIIDLYLSKTKENPNLKFYLILSSSNPNTIKSAIKEYKIPENHPNIKFDYKNTYLDYVKPFVNPRLTFIKNNKIHKIEAINPDQIIDLPKMIDSHFSPEN